jgi:hypothetical protein
VIADDVLIVTVTTYCVVPLYFLFVRRFIRSLRETALSETEDGDQ